MINPKLSIRNPQSENVFIIFILIFFTSLFLSCEDKTEIPEEKFIKIYVDLLVMQDTTVVNPVSLDSMKIIVFTRHNINSNQYEKTIAEYNSSPERWEKFFDKTLAYVEELKAKHGK